MCCRRTGRRKGQVPSGHRRTGLHVHRTHWLLSFVRSSVGGFAVFVSCCCLRSHTCRFLHTPYRCLSSTALLPTAFADDAKQSLSRSKTFTTSVMSFSRPPTHFSQAFDHRKTYFNTKQLSCTTVAALETGSLSVHTAHITLRRFETIH